MNRIVLGALLIVTSVCASVAAAQCPPSCPIPGGGAAESDCHAEFAASRVRLNFPPFDPSAPAPRTELHCFDGDPGCDVDGQVDGTCTFNIDLCLHNADPALTGCTPAQVTAVTIENTESDPDLTAAQTAVNALLPASSNVCTTGQTLRVPVTAGANGRPESAAKQVRLSAVTDGGTDDDTLEVTCVPRGWPTYGYNYGNHRASPRETIVSPENAETLKVKWHFEVAPNVFQGSRFNGVTATPTVGWGLVYVATWANTLFALHEEDGEIEWSYQFSPSFPLGLQATPTLTADGRLVVGDAGAKVYCLDARTGRLLWERDLSIPFTGEPPADHHWGSPTIANNRVFIGIASHTDQPCTRGRLAALDLDTGEVLWDLATAPLRVCSNDTSIECTSDPECGEGNTCVRGRGAGVTATPAVDATGEIVYMNTVGCYTFPSIGDSDTMFRLDAATGDVVWKNRVQPPEQFNSCEIGGAECRNADECEEGGACTEKMFYHDFGFLNGPLVIDGDNGQGGTRQLIVSGSKDGTLYAFDPETGDEVWTNEIVPVPVSPNFAAYGLFNGAIAFADQRIHAALNSVAAPMGSPPDHLRAFSIVDGEELWQDEIGQSWSHVGVANNVLYTGTNRTMGRCDNDLTISCQGGNEACAPDGTCIETSEFYIYDARDGRRLKTTILPAVSAGGPSIAYGSVYVPYGTLGQVGGVVAYALPGCVGDCNRDGEVAINELITGVRIALDESPLNRCYALDRNENLGVDIDELVTGVDSALSGCEE